MSDKNADAQTLAALTVLSLLERSGAASNQNIENNDLEMEKLDNSTLQGLGFDLIEESKDSERSEGMSDDVLKAVEEERGQNRELQSKLEESDRKITDLYREISELEDLLQSEAKAKKMIESEMEELNNRLRGTVKASEKEKDAALARVKELENENDTLKSSLTLLDTSLKSERNTNSKAINSNVIALQEEKIKLEQKLEQQANEIKDLTEETSRLTQINLDLNQKYENEVSELKNSLEENAVSHKKELESLNSKISAIEMEKDNAVQMATKLSVKLKSDLRKLSKQRNKQDTRINQLEEELAGLREKENDIASEESGKITALTLEIETLRGEILALSEENNTLKSNASRFTTEKKTLESALNDMTDKNFVLNVKISELTKENKRLKDEITAAMDEVSKLSNTVNSTKGTPAKPRATNELFMLNNTPEKRENVGGSASGKKSRRRARNRNRKKSPQVNRNLEERLKKQKQKSTLRRLDVDQSNVVEGPRKKRAPKKYGDLRENFDLRF